MPERREQLLRVDRAHGGLGGRGRVVLDLHALAPRRRVSEGLQRADGLGLLRGLDVAGERSELRRAERALELPERRPNRVGLREPGRRRELRRPEIQREGLVPRQAQRAVEVVGHVDPHAAVLHPDLDQVAGAVRGEARNEQEIEILREIRLRHPEDRAQLRELRALVLDHVRNHGEQPAQAL